MILVSIADAAHFTHIPASTIRRWLTEHRITGYGGKPWKVDMLEVEKQATRRNTDGHNLINRHRVSDDHDTVGEVSPHQQLAHRLTGE